MQESEWLQAVVRVGGGRGFVIETDRERLIVTAAHCLPHRPEPHAWAERTYTNLVALLGEELTIWAECEFADPASDLAVLRAPDNQRLPEEAEKFESLVEAAVPLPIGGLAHVPSAHTLPDGSTFLGQPEAESEARLLSLDCRWFLCKVKSVGRGLWIEDAVNGIRGGMSGSPIVTPEGVAIGIVCYSMGSGDDLEEFREGGPNPELAAHLPLWLAKAFGLLPQE